jgi:hypothetical protein
MLRLEENITKARDPLWAVLVRKHTRAASTALVTTLAAL